MYSQHKHTACASQWYHLSIAQSHAVITDTKSQRIPELVA